MKSLIFPLTILFCLSWSVTAETVTYKTVSEGKTTVEPGTVVKTEEGGLFWTSTTTKESTTKAGRTADGTMVAVEVDSKNGTWALKAEGDVLKGSGSIKDKPVTGSLPLQGRVWAIGFDQPLRWYVTKKLSGTMTFLMVNPLELAKPQEMTLTPDGKDTVEGKPALRFKLGLPGALSMFWSATVWADPATGDQVQYKGNRGPGTAEFVVTTIRS